MAQARAAGTPAPGAAGSHDLPVFVLTGPTGAGKTDWALGLAESAPVEIVSVDSALVYRGLDIGTAKPARELRERSEEHTSELQSRVDLVCRLLLEKKNKKKTDTDENGNHMRDN